MINGKYRNGMKLSHLSPLFLLLFVAGCGSMSLENKRVDYKSTQTAAPSLEIPPDLTTPATRDKYAIPEAGTESANYSDFSKNGATLSARATTVLPETGKAHLMHSGLHRWLLVDEKPENVWPLVIGFWKENGFVIKSENTQTGIIETDWAENRAKIPKTGLRKIIGKVFDNLYDSGEKDMYRTRIERTADGKGTEIYVTQYGMELVLSADKTISQWQSRPNDPDLEATMVQTMMAKLGGDQTGATASTTGSGHESSDTPKLQIQPGGDEVIVLAEPFDRSWRKVGIALDHTDYVVEDKDRAKGLYFIRVVVVKKKEGLGKLAFWRKDEESKPLQYQVFVRENGNYCEVGAHNTGGGSDLTSKSVVDELFKNVSQQ